jgi:hypothetical protein
LSLERKKREAEPKLRDLMASALTSADLALVAT